jgi:hypothetical protein
LVAALCGIPAAADWHSFALRDDGTIPVWSIAGPFPNTSLLTHGPGCFGYFTDFLADSGGEGGCIPNEGDAVIVEKGGTIYWQTAFTDMTGHLDFIETFEIDKETPGVAYSFCRLQSPVAADAVLKVSSNDGVRVWFNGVMVHENHVGRTVDEGGIDVVPVSLQAGPNTILVKVDQGLGGWGQRVRVENPDGAPISNVAAEVQSPSQIVGSAHAARLATTSLVARTPEGERQIVRARIDSGGLTGVRCVVSKAEWPEPYEFPLGDLPPGRHHVEFGVPVVTKDGAASAMLISDAGRNELANIVFQRPRQWTVYCVQHTHTDIGYTRPQDELLPDFLRHIDFALDYCDQTDDYPEASQFRWTCEASWVVQEYLRRRPVEQIERLRRRVAEGRIEVTGLYLNMDDLADENVMAESLRPIQEFRNAGLTVTTAMQNDVPGAAWCLVDYLSQFDVPYLTMGINNDRTPRPFDRPTAFWWESPSGNRILAWRPDHYHTGNHLGIHQGRLETLKGRTLEYLGILADKGYPFDEVAVQYSGIQIDNSPPSLTASDLIREWNETYAWPKLRNAVAREFPQYVEKHYAGTLPVYRGAWPNWWTDGFAFAHVETAEARRTHVDLGVAQALLSMAVLAGAELPASALMEMASLEEDLLFYDEHTFGAQEEFTQPMAENTIVQWGEKVAHIWNAVKECSMLRDTALGLLESSIPRADVPTIAIFNSLNWPRSGLVEVYIGHDILPLDRGYGLVDASTGESVPAQVSKSRYEGSYWTLWAEDVPPMGYRLVRIEQQTPRAPELPSTPANVLENQFYRMEIDPGSGAVLSMFDKVWNCELVDRDAPWQLGQFIYDTLTDNSFSDRDSFLERSTRTKVRNVRVEPGEPSLIWDSLQISADADGCIDLDGTPGLTCEIRLFKHKKQVDFQFMIRKAYVNQPESVYIAFPFGIPDGEIVYEVQGGLVRPGEDQLPGSSSDWTPIQGFLAIRNSDGQIVFTSDEIPLVQLGDINMGKWQYIAEVDQPHVYSWVMNNYWTYGLPGTKESEFSWNYHLTSTADTSTAVASRLGSEMRTPLIGRVFPAGTVADGPSHASILPWQTSKILLVNCTPAAGGGVLIHLREVAGEQSELSLPAGVHAEVVDVLGNRLDEATPPIAFKPFEVKFLRLSGLTGLRGRLFGVSRISSFRDVY